MSINSSVFLKKSVSTFYALMMYMLLIKNKNNCKTTENFHIIHFPLHLGFNILPLNTSVHIINYMLGHF